MKTWIKLSFCCTLKYLQMFYKGNHFYQSLNLYICTVFPEDSNIFENIHLSNKPNTFKCMTDINIVHMSKQCRLSMSNLISPYIFQRTTNVIQMYDFDKVYSICKHLEIAMFDIVLYMV